MMKKLHVWGWFISGFLKKHKKLIFLGASLGIVMSIFLIWILPYIPRPNPVKKIGLIGQYKTDKLPDFVTSKIGQGLVAVLEDGSPVPLLAEKWEVSDDGLKYAFYLKDNLYWQDGTKIVSSDLVYNFSDVSSEVKNDSIIIFTLKKPYSPFPTLLSMPVMKHNKIGTGEYALKTLKQKSSLVDEIVLEGPDDIIVVKFYPNLDAGKTAFMLGEIDELKDVIRNPFEGETEWERALDVAVNRKTNQHIGLFLNNDDPTFKDNKSFRQALAYATKKPTDESRALGPISRSSWAYNEDLKPYDFDPKRAQELAEKALGNMDKVRETTLKISTTSNYLPLAETVKADWQEVLGIKVEIEVVNALPPNFQVLLASQEIPSDPDQYSLWHSTQTQNIVQLKNVRLDNLLEKGRQETDSKIRKDYYYDFQKYFVEESPVIFLHYPENYTITRKETIKPALWSIIQFGRN